MAYRRALTEGPDEPDLLAELGTLLWEMGMQDDAYPLILRAATLCAVDPGLAWELGQIELERGNLVDAQRHLTTAKHLDPGDRRIDATLEQLALRKRDRKKRRPRAA
jgi:Flp pilus assembly protein TadD